MASLPRGEDAGRVLRRLGVRSHHRFRNGHKNSHKAAPAAPAPAEEEPKLGSATDELLAKIGTPKRRRPPREESGQQAPVASAPAAEPKPHQ